MRPAILRFGSSLYTKQLMRILLAIWCVWVGLGGVLSGINDLKWTGHNANKSVIYVIFAKIGDTAPYVIVGTCTTQKFRHMGTTAGEFYQYRVRAQAARGLVSDWSNIAVVYGI